MKSDYLSSANEVYYNLKTYEDDFDIQTKVITTFKCMLLRNEEIKDFIIDGIYVNVYDNENNAILYFNDYILRVDISDKQIIDYDISK